MKKILVLVGTRPNFIKVTQFKRIALQYPNIDLKIAHTGQHYDQNMSKVFFEQFNLKPDYFLEATHESVSDQFASIISTLSSLINKEYKPDLIIVPGDVNSTLAGALTARLHQIPIAHLESGLRSEDRSMPEEINRILTDEISDHFFITEKSGVENLKKEEKKGEIVFVGNTMIDTLVYYKNDIDSSKISTEHRLKEQEYFLLTMHRPSNVDSKEGLLNLVELVKELSVLKKLVLPLHPRTISKLKEYKLFDLINSLENTIILPPLGYFEFQHLVKNALTVITDSGGIQEETTYYQVPCLTYRKNTERPITIESGTNTLVNSIKDILNHITSINNGTYKKGECPKFWDGKATERVFKYLVESVFTKES